MADKLFIYGTLHPDHAPREIYDVVKTLRHLGKGTIRGKLYDLGEYPGAVLEKGTTERVQGAVFELPDDPGTLASLDQYEDFLPGHPENSLFVRSKTTVTLADGSQKRCWVYFYNRPPSAKPHASVSKKNRVRTPPDRGAITIAPTRARRTR